MYSLPPAPALSSRQLAALLERLPDIVWRYRVVPDRGFEYVSPSVFPLTGYTPAEHYADPDLGRRIVHPDDLPVMQAAIRTPEDHRTVTLRWRHKAGLELTTEQRILASSNDSGEVIALEGVGRPVISGDRGLQLRAGDLMVDLATHRVLVDDRVVELTPAEHRILVLLATTDGPAPPAALAARLWGDDGPGGPRAVEVHVSNLRRKIEEEPRRPRRLLTRRGVGYELRTGTGILKIP